MQDATTDRRPLKTRSWRVFQSLASWLARCGVSPNAISVASVGFAVLGAVGLIATNWVDDGSLRRLCWLVAGAGIQLRLIANLLDGMVAVEGGRASATGPLYNEVPDRLSDPILLVAAGYAAGAYPIAGWAAAAIALLVAYIRAIAASVGAGQIFLGPMAKPQRMAILSAVCVAGAVLPDAWMTLRGPGIPVASESPSSPNDWGVMTLALWIIVAGGAFTVVRRLQHATALLKRAAESPS